MFGERLVWTRQEGEFTVTSYWGVEPPADAPVDPERDGPAPFVTIQREVTPAVMEEAVLGKGGKVTQPRIMTAAVMEYVGHVEYRAAMAERAEAAKLEELPVGFVAKGEVADALKTPLGKTGI
jgi:hypothetical protein